MQFKKSIIIIILIIVILVAVLLGAVILFWRPALPQKSDIEITQNQEKANEASVNNNFDNSETFLAKDISKVTDQDIVAFLKTNSDAKDYMDKNKDFEIRDKVILTEASILTGQKAENFKEVYQGLELEDNRYLKVDLINKIGNSGLVAVLDSKENKVIKAYGLILFSTGMQ